MKYSRASIRDPNALVLALIGVLLPTLVMLPVLLWPHYGLFSDAGQAIAFPKEVLRNLPQSLQFFRPLEDGRWNPLFHALTTLVYAIAPDSPRALYIMQWLMLCGSSIALGWILFSFTRSKKFALTGIALFCFGSSIFESFYTLDKVEPRITFFSALALLVFVLIHGGRFSSAGASQRRQYGFVAIQAFLGVLAVFSKETGLYLAAAFFATWIASLLNGAWGPETKKLLRNAAAVHGTVAVIFVFLFKFLSADMSYRYVKYEVTLGMIGRNVAYYLASSPELALGLLCSIYWCFSVLWRRCPGPQGGVRPFLVLISVALLAYFLGISLWRWPLDYYLLPAQYLTSLLVPLTAWALSPYFGKGSATVRSCIMLCAGLIWLGFVAFRIMVGSAVYAQDAVKDELAVLLSGSEWSLHRVVVPLTHPESAEIGERLEYFINLQRPAVYKVDLFNFWEPPVLNRDNLQRFKFSAGMVPSDQQLAQVAMHPDRYVIWQFVLGTLFKYENKPINAADSIASEPNTPWQADFLRPGDIVLVPTGSHWLAWVNARGIAMYARTTEDFIRRTPIRLRYLGGVRSGIWGAELGWDVLRVEQLPSDETSYQGYGVAALSAFNSESDIVPNSSTSTLFAEQRHPAEGVFLGKGWYDLENAGGRQFHWMGSKAEIVLTRMPAGVCSVELEIEPLLMGGLKSLVLKAQLGEQETQYSIRGREVVRFDFTSQEQSVQVIRLHIEGGADHPPPGDTRLLVARAFAIRLTGCRHATQ